MAERGAYAKGVRKREEILATALEFVAEHGYSSTTIRELASAVGLSPTGLLHYFGTKEELFVEILRRRDALDAEARGVVPGEEASAPHAPQNVTSTFVDVIRHNAAVPGLVQLYVGLSAEAVEPGHAAHDYFQQRYAVTRAAAAEGIRAEQSAGAVRDDVGAEVLAALLIAAADGLQSQWAYDPTIDMGEHVARLVDLLRPPQR
jgi:AcrR family transcriptional regulator